MAADSYAAVTDSVAIQPAKLRDLFPLHRLEKRCFPIDSWPMIDIVMALLMPRLVRLKVVWGGQVIGFVLGERERGVGWIATFGIDPDFRNRGIGTRLLLEAEQVLGTMSFRLCVRSSNEPAIHLYRRNGYQSVDVWRRYYKGGEDALVMEKII